MRKIPHWLEEFNPGESTDILRDLALSHACQGGRVGSQIATLIRRERFREICEFEFSYPTFLAEGYTSEQVYNCRQAVAFFSKLEGLEIGIDKEEAALEKFLEAEEACRFTNELFRAVGRGLTFSPSVESQLFAARRKIAMVLGPVPSLERLGYRFGKGATSLTKKRMASLREKFRVGVSCSEELFPAAKAVLGELPALCESWADMFVHDELESWFSIPVSIHDGRLDFVPKNAKTYRSTVTEPVLNGLYQLAIGDYMFDLLKRSGLDLRDQTRNQRLAREGSLTGALATLDLSSASDMVATELVYHLLPLDWAAFLARGRSGHVTYKGHRITLEKFSSMGNGFTFPLESLIFWALTCAVCDPDDVVSVYGDDIICPSDKFEGVAKLLATCGFSVNHKKSFHDGPFRESCGKDYYGGIDIRPYYQDTWVNGLTLFTLHNYYVRRGDLTRAEVVRKYIHPALQIFGPDGYGDGHLIGDHPRSKRDRHYRQGYAGYTFDTFTVRGRKDIRPALSGDFVLPAYSVYRRSGESEIADVSTEQVGKFARAPSQERGRFLRAFLRGFGDPSSALPIPDHKIGEGATVKGTPVPDTDPLEYKRVSIYTLAP